MLDLKLAKVVLFEFAVSAIVARDNLIA